MKKKNSNEQLHIQITKYIYIYIKNKRENLNEIMKITKLHIVQIHS